MDQSTALAALTASIPQLSQVPQCIVHFDTSSPPMFFANAQTSSRLTAPLLPQVVVRIWLVYAKMRTFSLLCKGSFSKALVPIRWTWKVRIFWKASVWLSCAFLRLFDYKTNNHLPPMHNTPLVNGFVTFCTRYSEWLYCILHVFVVMTSSLTRQTC